MCKIKSIFVIMIIYILLFACTSEKAEEMNMRELMRQWTIEAQMAKDYLENGEIHKIELDTSLPLYAWHTPPSDSTVLEERFYKFSESFVAKKTAFYDEPDISSYNLMVSSCIDCHQSYCPGPLRSINALYITQQTDKNNLRN
jgi:hypothetical protein